jgi:hypothetical protein
MVNILFSSGYNVDSAHARNFRAIQHRTFLFAASWGGFLHPSQHRCFRFLLWSQCLSLQHECIALWQSLAPLAGTTFLSCFLLPSHYGRSTTDSSQKSDRAVAETKQIPAAHIPHRLQVSISTQYDQYPMSQTSHLGSYVSVDEQLRDKASGLSLGNDLESGTER